MKGKKMVFAVILSLIVCLLLVPTCAYAENESTENPTTPVEEPVIPETPVEDTKIPQTTVEGGDNPEITAESGDTPDDSSQSGENTENKGFQVELTYGDKVAKRDGLQGGESFDLAEILHELGINGEVTEAKGNADDLFNVTSDENGMRFNTLAAFGDPYQLVVTVDGVSYVIDVTDDGAILNTETAEQWKNNLINAANGQTVQLATDITTSECVERTGNNSGKTITIDFNGNTLNYTGSSYGIRFNDGATYILQNGTFNGNIRVGFNSKVTLASNFTLKGLVGVYGENNTDVGNDTSLDVYGSVIQENLNYAIATSGSRKGASITIYDGATVSSTKASAIYLPSGNLTVKGGTIKGTTGIYMKAGSLVLNGGTVIGTGEHEEYQPSGNGSTATGDAIVVEYPQGSSYGKIENVNIYGGSVISENAKAVAKYVSDSNGQENRDQTKVDGGVFSDDSVKEFVDPNYGVVATIGGMYAVNETILENVKPGDTVELVKVGDNANIDEFDVPAGVTIVNKTDKNITINGITIKAGESYTTPIPATTGEVFYAKYYVVEGKEQEWTKGSADGLKFELNSDKVVKVLIDGVEVEFTVENGEIVIAPEVLEALEAGEHEIEFVFDDGSCKTTFVIA